MKLIVDSLEETYALCMSSGCVHEKHVDEELARSLHCAATEGLAFAQFTSQQLSATSTFWTFIFRDYYEVLRTLIQAYLILHGITAQNHQCAHAYLCKHYPALEVDWVFLETIRLKRNAINYRGSRLNYSDWNLLSLNFSLHISSLNKTLALLLGL